MSFTGVCGRFRRGTTLIVICEFSGESPPCCLFPARNFGSLICHEISCMHMSTILDYALVPVVVGEGGREGGRETTHVDRRGRSQEHGMKFLRRPPRSARSTHRSSGNGRAGVGLRRRYGRVGTLYLAGECAAQLQPLLFSSPLSCLMVFLDLGG